MGNTSNSYKKDIQFFPTRSKTLKVIRFWGCGFERGEKIQNFKSAQFKKKKEVMYTAPTATRKCVSTLWLTEEIPAGRTQHSST